MGADIHWILERRHEDGAWEAVHASDVVQAAQNAGGRGVPDALKAGSPADRFGERWYRLFAILSGVRGSISGQARPLATPGLPRDRSEYSALNMPDEGPDTVFHTIGHLGLGDLRRAVDEPHRDCLPSDEDIACASMWRHDLEGMIAGPRSLELDLPLQGPSRDWQTGEWFPLLDRESNHAKLARRARGSGLLAITDQTLRVIIGYDS